MYWKVIGNNMQGVEKAGQIYPLPPSFMGQTWVIVFLAFLFFISRIFDSSYVLGCGRDLKSAV